MSEYIISDEQIAENQRRHGKKLLVMPVIVRCRDCEHYDPHPTDDGVCFLPDGNGGFAYWEVEPDGYCKWGERRQS